MPVTIAYWGGVRGRVQPIRTFCKFANIEFVDKLYTSPQEWGADKAALAPTMPFVNIPHVIDGDF